MVEHILDHPIDMLIPEAVAKGNQRTVGATNCSGEVAEQINIGIGRCLSGLGRVWINHKLQASAPASPGAFKIGIDTLCPKRQADASNASGCIHPIERAMQFSERATPSR